MTNSEAIRTYPAEYNIWCGMHGRCYCETNEAWDRYGGRGVSIYSQWKGRGNFVHFIEYVGARPSRQHSIDRYPNNDGNYEPGNVRWATRLEQSRNRRNVRVATFNGETRPLYEWAAITNIAVNVIRQRLDTYGWSVAEALSVVSGAGRDITGKTAKNKIFFEYDGRRLSLAAWAAVLSLPYVQLHHAIKRKGLDFHAAVAHVQRTHG